MATALAPKKKGARKKKAKREQEHRHTLLPDWTKPGNWSRESKLHIKAVVEALESGLDHAMKAGEYLAVAKKLVGHGCWADWIEENCEFSYRTARNYIRVYTHREQLPQREDTSYRRAIKMLRTDPTKKTGKKKQSKHVIRIIDLGDLKKLVSRYKIDTEVAVLLPLLEDLGIRVKSPKE